MKGKIEYSSYNYIIYSLVDIICGRGYLRLGLLLYSENYISGVSITQETKYYYTHVQAAIIRASSRLS